MRPTLRIALLVSAVAAVWAASQSDDDKGAPARSGSGQRAAAGPGRDKSSPVAEPRDRRGARGSARTASHEEGQAEPWAATALVQGVTTWRPTASAPEQPLSMKAQFDAVPALARTAWSGLQPPPPPPQPVVVQAPPPPPPPMTPPFPHAWVGRFNDEPAGRMPRAASGVAPAGAASVVATVRRAVLVSPQATWVVRVGDVIEGQWRIDQIEERTMRLTYLPLQQSQTIAMK